MRRYSPWREIQKRENRARIIFWIDASTSWTAIVPNLCKFLLHTYGFYASHVEQRFVLPPIVWQRAIKIFHEMKTTRQKKVQIGWIEFHVSWRSFLATFNTTRSRSKTIVINVSASWSFFARSPQHGLIQKWTDQSNADLALHSAGRKQTSSNG